MTQIFILAVLLFVYIVDVFILLSLFSNFIDCFPYLQHSVKPVQILFEITLDFLVSNKLQWTISSFRNFLHLCILLV